MLHVGRACNPALCQLPIMLMRSAHVAQAKKAEITQKICWFLCAIYEIIVEDIHCSSEIEPFVQWLGGKTRQRPVAKTGAL